MCFDILWVPRSLRTLMSKLLEVIQLTLACIHGQTGARNLRLIQHVYMVWVTMWDKLSALWMATPWQTPWPCAGSFPTVIPHP